MPQFLRRVWWYAIALTVLPTVAGAQAQTSIVGAVDRYVVKPGDSLRGLAALFGVDVATIEAANRLRINDVLPAGRQLQIDHRHIVPPLGDTELVINVPQRMIFVRRESGAVEAYPIAIGSPSTPTPRGDFTIVSLQRDPVWYVPPSIQAEMRAAGRPVRRQVPPGPDNPLGDRWMGLSLAHVGIHGTNQPRSIYGAVTHGCLRLRPEHARLLFEAVAVGIRGRVVYEPALMTIQQGRVYVEVHPDIYALGAAPITMLSAALREKGWDTQVDLSRLRTAAREHAGIAVDITAAAAATEGTISR